MSDQDAFERILASLSDAMLDASLWPTTSALIDEACGTQGNTLIVAAGPRDAMQIHTGGFYYRGQRREDLEVEYRDVYHPIDERVPRLRRLPDNLLVHASSLYTARELQTSPAYNEWLPRVHAQDGMHGRLAEPDGSHITWAFADPVAPGGWHGPQIALIEGLMPHIRQFVRVRQALAKAESLSASLTALLDTTRVGVIHLDRQGKIVAANDRARSLLRRGDGLVDRQGVLYARSPADQARFTQLVARALPTSSTPAVGGSMRIRQMPMRPPFVVHVTPVNTAQPDFGARAVAALVLLVESGWPFEIEPHVVAELLGLTPGESQTAVGLAEGRTAGEIAQATGRTVGAVHWHLRQIYRKHHINRQAELVRLVLSVTALAGR